MPRRTTPLTAGVVLVSCALAAPPTLSQERPSIFAIRAARMLDVASGRMIPKPVIVVEGERIKSVGGPMPSGVTSVDLGEATLLPGFIDTHTHLTLEFQPGWETRPARETHVDYALRGVRAARDTLLAGFTTVRDLGSFGFTDVKLGQAIERGDIIGPRIVAAGHNIGITGGHCDLTGFAPGIFDLDYRQGVADGPDGVLRAVRYQIKHGARVIKVCATAGVLSFEESVGAQQMSQAELRAAVEEAARHGLKVAAHAHGSDGIVAAIKAGVASIEHGSILTDEAIELLKRHGTYLVPQAFIGDWLNPEDLPPLSGRRTLRSPRSSRPVCARRSVRASGSRSAPMRASSPTA